MATQPKKKWLPVCVTACLLMAASGFVVWRYLADATPPITSPVGDSVGTVTTQGAQTGPTNYWDTFFLPTSPEAWYAVGETVDWNKVVDVCVENYTVGKSLPEGFHREDVRYYVPGPLAEEGGESLIAEEADENGTLTSPHVYVEVTASFVCTGMLKSLEDGLPEPDSFPFAAASQALSWYSRTAGKIVSDVETNAVQLLSTEWETDYHFSWQLHEGDTIRLKLLYILPESTWQDADTELLFTPVGGYQTWMLKELGYTQPHIWLKNQ